MRAKALPILALIALAAVMPAALAIPVRVIGPDNAPVAGVAVKAVNGTTTIASGTTNSTGWVELDVPNGTMVFVVDYNNTVDVIDVRTVTVTPGATVVINMSEMYWVKIQSTVIKAEVEVVEPTTETEFTYTANESIIYTDDLLNYTYPTEVSAFPYKYVLKEIRYDGSTTTDNFVAVKPTANMEITGVYERTWWIALTTEQIIIIILSAVAIILILLAVTRGGAKAVLEHRREYWSR